MDHERRLRRSIPCAGCGYDLRGIDEFGVCPECGRSVEESMRLVTLANAPADHVKQLLRAITMIEIGAWAFSASIVTTATMVLICVGVPVVAVALIASSIGWIVLALGRGRSDWKHTDTFERRRRWLLWVIIARGAAVILWIPVAQALAGQMGGLIVGFSSRTITSIGIIALFGVKHALGLALIADLFRISGGTRLARLSRAMLIACPFLFALGLFVFLAGSYIFPNETHLIAILVFAILAGIWAIAYAIVLDCLRLRLAWLHLRLSIGPPASPVD